ncbi:MAG: hypothetical protein AUG50_03470 [Betaproteobacteria bacterium 13_1_20CM_3_63_8]|nr:MAG: hypothetical protein AUG50_03470 [Betaproteobacteria bacterium 13_1_20CM_3_63_8]
MEVLFAFLSHLVLFLSLTTLVFAFGAYASFMLRRRRPLLKRRAASAAGEVALLRRYVGSDHD